VLPLRLLGVTMLKADPSYHPRLSIDTTPEIIAIINTLIPYGKRMDILAIVLENFAGMLQRNPREVLSALLLGDLPMEELIVIGKVSVSRSLLMRISHALDTIPMFQELAKELRKEIEECT